jgi:hypothetical protein
MVFAIFPPLWEKFLILRPGVNSCNYPVILLKVYEMEQKKHSGVSLRAPGRGRDGLTRTIALVAPLQLPNIPS